MLSALEFLPHIKKVKDGFIAEISEIDVRGEGLTRDEAEKDLLMKTQKVLLEVLAEEFQLT